MAKTKSMFYRKEMDRTEKGEVITVICRMERGHCDFVYAEVSGDFPGTSESGVYDASDYQYLLGASVKTLEHMGFLPV
jgi:hypothetical protein